VLCEALAKFKHEQHISTIRSHYLASEHGTIFTLIDSQISKRYQTVSPLRNLFRKLIFLFKFFLPLAD